MLKYNFIIKSIIILILTNIISANIFASTNINTIVNIRDTLLFDTNIGSQINNMYYHYSPLAVGAIVSGAAPIAILTPQDQKKFKQLRKYFNKPENLLKPGNFGQLGPIFINKETQYAYSVPNTLKTINAPIPKIIGDLKSKAAKQDWGKGIRQLGRYGLKALLLFFKAIPIIAILILLLIAGCLGRWWPTILPPMVLVALLLCYAPNNTKHNILLSTAINNHNIEDLRTAFLYRKTSLSLNTKNRQNAVLWLQTLFNSASVKERYYAAAVAGELKLTQLRDKLTGLAENDPIINVRYMSIEALSKLPKTTNILKQLALKSPSLYEKHYLLNALLRRGVSWNSLSCD